MGEAQDYLVELASVREYVRHVRGKLVRVKAHRTRTPEAQVGQTHAAAISRAFRRFDMPPDERTGTHWNVVSQIARSVDTMNEGIPGRTSEAQEQWMRRLGKSPLADISHLSAGQRFRAGGTTWTVNRLVTGIGTRNYFLEATNAEGVRMPFRRIAPFEGLVETKKRKKLDYDALPAHRSLVGATMGEAQERLIMLASREFSTQVREKYADKNIAMPDGSFPIPDKDALRRAIQSIGRAKNPAAAKAHIKRRAAALGATDMLPADW